MAKKKEIPEVVYSTVESVAGISLGTVITHETFSNLLDVDFPGDAVKYRSYVRYVNKLLQHIHGIFIKSVRGVGYLLVKRGDEINVIIPLLNKHMKGIEQVRVSTACIRVDEIDDPVKRELTIRKQAEIFTLNLINKYGQVA